MPQGTAVSFSGLDPPLDAADAKKWHYMPESALNWRVTGQPVLEAPVASQVPSPGRAAAFAFAPLCTIVNAPNSIAFYADTPDVRTIGTNAVVLPFQVDWQVLSGPGGGCRFDPRPIAAGVTIFGTPDFLNRQGWLFRIAGDPGCDYVLMARIRPVAPNTLPFQFAINLVARVNSLALTAPGPAITTGAFIG